jgi:hypothetical protein
MSRAPRSLWILVAATILAAGGLAQALAAPASTGADALVAVSGVLLVVCPVLLVRVLRYLTRALSPTTTLARGRNRRTRR